MVITNQIDTRNQVYINQMKEYQKTESQAMKAETTAATLSISPEGEALSRNMAVASSVQATKSTPVLKEGSKGTAVKQLQVNLTKLGYDTKGTDGIFGANTKKAVIEFQKVCGLTADGIVGTNTQKQIERVLSNQKNNILALGSKGKAVRELQNNLKKLGYDPKSTDGTFGSNTQKAVKEFQKVCGLTVDGIVGANTKKQIERVLSNQANNMLALGSKGNEVKELQNNLIKLGYDPKSTDGKFDQNTQKAVKAFQKAMIDSGKDTSLSANGKVGKKTKAAIKKELDKIKKKPVEGLTKEQRKMIDNLKKDTSLGLSADKKTAMVYAAERMFKDGYEAAFVAGMLGNIQNEGEPGKFESSNYKTHPENEPAYLKYMDEHFDYRSKYSGKNISEVGIKEAIALQEKVVACGYKGKFGLGMIQWTGDRTTNILEAYKKYCSSNNPTKDECIKAEVNFMADELKNNYKAVYKEWKNGSKKAKSAGEIICKQYERPKDKEKEAIVRGENSTKIYDVMMK